MKSIVSTLDNGSSDLSEKKKGMDRTMKAIVTVIGKDQVGITASVCTLLAQHQINILDISQTVLQELSLIHI
mgnify:FL=1